MLQDWLLLLLLQMLLFTHVMVSVSVLMSVMALLLRLFWCCIFNNSSCFLQALLQQAHT